MKNSVVIAIKKVPVELTWWNGTASDSLGLAIHTVTESQMEAGYGPCDGETFEFEGKQFRLGEHDYETDGDEVTCIANIYSVEG